VKNQLSEIFEYMEQDQQFVEFVVKALVDHPDDVKTERTVDEMGVLITLHLNAQDMGQVIGRSGQTAKSIRTLLRVVGAKHKARVNLKIYEPEGSHRGPRREYAPRTGGYMGGMGHTSAPSASSTDAIDDFKL
jgi:predicted RNA-binding protein YlqC (UPF0109 family)